VMYIPLQPVSLQPACICGM